MPVNVPASHGDAAHPQTARRVDPDPTIDRGANRNADHQAAGELDGKLDRKVDRNVVAIDERLFNPAGWFVIDTNNHYVQGVVVPSLTTGLQLLGKGRNAALVGRLRPGALAIDIDVPGDFGHWLTHEIAGWLRNRSCWVLLRPSGGADGRFHLFTTPGEHRQDLQTYLEELRVELKLRKTDLDPREIIRPLSSPHRHGATTRPRGDLREALRTLKKVFPDLPQPAPVTRRSRAALAGATAPSSPTGSVSDGSNTTDATGTPGTPGNVAPLFPHHHAHRDLRPEWRHYLLTGALPAGNWRRTPGSRATGNIDRSLVEAALTRECVWAGFDAGATWQMIREAHPQAMTKARFQGRDWWIQWVWNKAVHDAQTFRPTPRQAPTSTAPTGPSPAVAAAVADARTRLEALQWTRPVRARATLLLVGHHVLDRMARTNALRVPVPERDLVLDTGIADRKTIRAALRLLDGPLGTLHRETLSLSPTDRASTSFEFEINPAIPDGGRQIPPPRFHTPSAPAGLWATLPRAAHTLWRTLLTRESPTELPDLLPQGGLVENKTDQPTKSQLTTAKQALIALEHAGMVRVDEHGAWRAATGPRPVSVEQRAHAAHRVLRDQIDVERAQYRTAQTNPWNAARAQALKAQKAKEKAWWSSLTPAVRQQRRLAWRAAFDDLSIDQQAQLKAKLADSRIRAGLNERDNYLDWVNSLSPDEYATRQLVRKARFETLSTNERGRSIEAWTRHRNRYGLPHPDPTRTRTHLDAAWPDTAAERDQAFLERQLHLPLPLNQNTTQSAAG